MAPLFGILYGEWRSKTGEGILVNEGDKIEKVYTKDEGDYEMNKTLETQINTFKGIVEEYYENKIRKIKSEYHNKFDEIHKDAGASKFYDAVMELINKELPNLALKHLDYLIKSENFTIEINGSPTCTIKDSEGREIPIKYSKEERQKFDKLDSDVSEEIHELRTELNKVLLAIDTFGEDTALIRDLLKCKAIIDDTGLPY